MPEQFNTHFITYIKEKIMKNINGRSAWVKHTEKAPDEDKKIISSKALI